MKIRKFSLFFKIYLSFLLTAMAAIGGSIYLERLADPGPAAHHWRHRSLTFHATESVRILDREGPRGLADYFSRLEQATGIRAFLLDAAGKEVSGRSVQKLPAGSATEKLTGAGGRAYVFTAALPPPPGPFLSPPGGPPPGPPPGHSLHFIARLSIQLIIAGIICYLFARYLTSPIIRMGSAARQFAAGDLSVRVGRELTARKDELSALALDFDLMASRIESLVTSQRNLLRDVSHELRSPLARLNVALELCRKRLGSEQIDPLDRIEKEAGKLNDLIGEILTYNRIESGTTDFGQDRIDLSALLGEITADANFEIHGERAFILQSEPCVLEGNISLLRRSIENTIRNALCHTDEDSRVEILLKVEGENGKREVLISVRDHGRGVPENELDLIFRPFYKSAAGKRSEGAGLGLAIAEAAVRRQGGLITARNAPQEGLIVEIRLPLST